MAAMSIIEPGVDGPVDLHPVQCLLRQYDALAIEMNAVEMHMSEMEYIIEYPAIKGVTMASVTVTSAIFPNLIQDQANDEACLSIIRVLQDQSHKDFKKQSLHFRLENGVLLHVSSSPNPLTERRWFQVVVPASHYRRVFDAFHEADIAAHRGARATQSSIMSTYYWPGMGNWIKQAVKQCDVCLRIRKPLPRLGYVTPSVPAFGEVWSIDYVGPYPTAASGFRYVLTFTERSTYWPEAYPTTAPDAKNVADVYCQKIIPRHGVAKKFISDLGAPFISSVMKHINTRLGTTHTFASSGNSRGNSIHENRHRPMTAGIIANLLQNKASKGNWIKYLAPALFMLRNGVPTGRDYSPAELRTGKKLYFPGELMPSEIKGNRDLRAVCYDVEDFFQKLAEIRQLAAQADVEYRTAMGDRQFTHRVSDFNVGDLVWLKWKVSRDNEEVKTKLDVNWIGPYYVLEKKGHSSYILQHTESGRKTLPIHLR